MRNILICEDEELTLQVLGNFVKSQKFTAFTATDGTEALKIMADNEIDLVISDIHMNPMDGVTLLETLRKDNNAVPFILITAHPDVETYIHALHELGAFEYIQKPLDLDILLSVIYRLLEK